MHLFIVSFTKIFISGRNKCDCFSFVKCSKQCHTEYDKIMFLTKRRRLAIGTNMVDIKNYTTGLRNIPCITSVTVTIAAQPIAHRAISLPNIRLTSSSVYNYALEK